MENMRMAMANADTVVQGKGNPNKRAPVDVADRDYLWHLAGLALQLGNRPLASDCLCLAAKFQRDRLDMASLRRVNA